MNRYVASFLKGTADYFLHENSNPWKGELCSMPIASFSLFIFFSSLQYFTWFKNVLDRIILIHYIRKKEFLKKGSFYYTTHRRCRFLGCVGLFHNISTDNDTDLIFLINHDSCHCFLVTYEHLHRSE